MKFIRLTVALFFAANCIASAAPAASSPREKVLLTGSGWKFMGAADQDPLPTIDSDAFRNATWQEVSVPHNFQTRAAYDALGKGWYRRKITLDPAMIGRELYLYFEGVAAIADVYVNGHLLGQHRGAYTAFVFNATAALHAGPDNEVAVLVDDSAASTADCLPNGTGLYKVWGGLYRKVWLLATAPMHIDPTDDAAPGIYLTPTEVSAKSAKLGVRVLLRNAGREKAKVEVRVKLTDPQGHEVKSFTAPAVIAPDGKATTEFSTTILQPQLWESKHGRLYNVEAGIYSNGKLLDQLTERTGFRRLVWDWKEKTVELNGTRTLLAGTNLHQETERKGSAVSDEDLIQNFDVLQDLGCNFLRLPHYPHARLEYDLCDERGILCWAENGNSNGRWVKNGDIAGPTAAQITTEMIKQNYNHPSIALWSVGNEASPEPADQCVPIVKALDPSRPVVVANMKQGVADYSAANTYPGWYNGSYDKYKAEGFISEIGAGGATTTHCDYQTAAAKVNSYEPEEYQQLVAESHLQKTFRGDNSHLGMFAWWCMRDFSDIKYKKPVGWNTKGLLTYAGDKKDIYYLYRCFLRPMEPTVHITSKRYFLRVGRVDNGIKVYSNAARLSLTLNGTAVSTLENGNYREPKGTAVDHVFYWPVPLCTGKNSILVSDEHGHTDSAIVYYEGEGALAAMPNPTPLVKDLKSANVNNQAYFMDMPVQPQWPIYYDLDSTADNSFDSLPPQIAGARWIATRRTTSHGKETDLSFQVTRPATIFVVATKMDRRPDLGSDSGFQEVATSDFRWRNNELQLVPAQLFSRQAAGGEVLHFPQSDRDQIVLLREQ